MGDEKLRVGPVKLFADGATAETVAFSLKIGGQIINSGKYRDDFDEMLFAATEKGFRVCVHSFGNATTDAVLTAFGNAALRAPAGFEMRPRLERVTLINELQIKRLAAMGGCACIQPQFLSRA
jgi:predicted amidohydrolase YtcJ